MDINTLRSIATVLAFCAFFAITIWAYSKRQTSRFDEAANLPFADDEDEMPSKQLPENEQK